MSQAIWRPPNLDAYINEPGKCYQGLSHKQKIAIWLLALTSSWLMGLGVVKLGLLLYTVLEQLI